MSFAVAYRALVPNVAVEQLEESSISVPWHICNIFDSNGSKASALVRVRFFSNAKINNNLNFLSLRLHKQVDLRDRNASRAIRWERSASVKMLGKMHVIK